MLSSDRIERMGELISERIHEAIELRTRLYGECDAMRLVFSEGDYLPGLIADRYGKCLVLQFLTYGMDVNKQDVMEIFEELLRPDVVVLRNDSRSRSLEGLPLYKEVVKGDLQSLPLIHEGGLIFEVDPLAGQKTGFFLDQGENRAVAADFIKGGKGLDLFCYTGAWSVRLAAAGAEVKAVDESESALNQAAKNADMNGFRDKIAFVREDVFSFLKREAGQGGGRYDFIILDPPAFVKSAGKLKEALKAYRILNRLCMTLIRPGGILVTASCSYHVGREMFLEMLRDAGMEAGRAVRMLALRSQAKDHPVLLSMPETEYLKCAFLMID
jgi:23S rRNA (cytosine1962-C5)-methyltransferase